MREEIFTTILAAVVFITLFTIHLSSTPGQTPAKKTHREARKPVLKGDYLGQEKPGLKPEIFAPGIVSTKENVEYTVTFSPDGKEFYFARRGFKDLVNTLMVMKQKQDGSWTGPQVAPFSGKYSDIEPYISHDGKKLFFASNRPRQEGGKAEEMVNVWVCDKTGAGWSAPRFFGFPFSEERAAMNVTATLEGTLYFYTLQGLKRSRFIKGKYTKPEKLDPAISYIRGGHPFIAPDESYLIFDYERELPDGRIVSQLYISFHKKDGSWTKAKEMGGPINANEHVMFPYVTHDGKYFFFFSKNDIYWVDARVININPTARGD